MRRVKKACAQKRHKAVPLRRRHRLPQRVFDNARWALIRGLAPTLRRAMGFALYAETTRINRGDSYDGGHGLMERASPETAQRWLRHWERGGHLRGLGWRSVDQWRRAHAAYSRQYRKEAKEREAKFAAFEAEQTKLVLGSGCVVTPQARYYITEKKLRSYPGVRGVIVAVGLERPGNSKKVRIWFQDMGNTIEEEYFTVYLKSAPLPPFVTTEVEPCSCLRVHSPREEYEVRCADHAPLRSDISFEMGLTPPLEAPPSPEEEGPVPPEDPDIEAFNDEERQHYGPGHH
jgi:hypothetical protein